MTNYKMEDLKLLNMSKREETYNEFMGTTIIQYFEIEDRLSVEEKIAFLDDIENGIATYMINVLTKWEQEKDTLPKDNYGRVKTVSKKAWIRKNDPREKIDVKFKIGSYHLFGNVYENMELTLSLDRYKQAFFEEHIAHNWFHFAIKQLFNAERNYFLSIDQKSINLSKIKEYGRMYGVLDNQIVNDIVWNGLKDISDKHIDAILAAFKTIEDTVKRESQKLFDTIGIK